MLGTILLSAFIFIVLFIVIIEIRNEKRYQAQRKAEKEKGFKKVEKSAKTVHQEKPKELDVRKETKEPEKPQKQLPQANHPKFSHARLIEMGLDDDEAKEFVSELIPQLETQIPLIEEKIDENDFHQVERLTHSIKGSTTNIGSGGVAELLVEFNTYVKKGTDKEIVEKYFELLKYYTKELKKDYSLSS